MSITYDSHGRPHAEKTHDVTVVGSVNADLAIRLDELPPAGQTVRGADAERGLGGKGANQAVAAARLGRRVAMVGAVGEDAEGRGLRDVLAAEGSTSSTSRPSTPPPGSPSSSCTPGSRRSS